MGGFPPVIFPEPHPYVTEGLGYSPTLLGRVVTEGPGEDGEVVDGMAKSGGRVTSFWAAQVLGSRPWVVLDSIRWGWMKERGLTSGQQRSWTRQKDPPGQPPGMC
jgi:hypothetical protein